MPALRAKTIQLLGLFLVIAGAMTRLLFGPERMDLGSWLPGILIGVGIGLMFGWQCLAMAIKRAGIENALNDD